jgi:hypothetical protein
MGAWRSSGEAAPTRAAARASFSSKTMAVSAAFARCMMALA